MARPKGSRTVLVRITYDTIGELAGGITGDTARQYAQRGRFDSRDLDSLLERAFVSKCEPNRNRSRNEDRRERRAERTGYRTQFAVKEIDLKSSMLKFAP